MASRELRKESLSRLYSSSLELSCMQWRLHYLWLFGDNDLIIECDEVGSDSQERPPWVSRCPRSLHSWLSWTSQSLRCSWVGGMFVFPCFESCFIISRTKMKIWKMRGHQDSRKAKKVDALRRIINEGKSDAFPYCKALQISSVWMGENILCFVASWAFEMRGHSGLKPRNTLMQ